MSLQVGNTNTLTGVDISADAEVLSLTPSTTLAKRVRAQITLTGLDSAGSVLLFTVVIDSKTVAYFNDISIASDTTKVWESPVLTVPANVTFAVRCYSTNPSNTAVDGTGVCWSAEEQDEATADHTTAGSAGLATATAAVQATAGAASAAAVEADYMRRSTSADIPNLTAAQLANAFIVNMADVEASAPDDSLCALVLGALHWSLSGDILTIKKTTGATFDTITVTSDTDADRITGAG